MKNAKIAWIISVIGSIIFWIADSAIDYYIFYEYHERSFVDLFLLDIPPRELFVRSIIVAFIIAAVWCIAWIHNKNYSRLQSEREAESRYGTFVDAAEDSIFIISREGTLEFVNDFGARLFDTEPEKIIGQPIENLFAGLEYQGQALSIKQVFKSGKSITADRLFHFGDREIWLHTKLTPLFKDNETIAVLGISRDISAQKRAEIELKKMSDKLSFIINNSTNLFYSHDINHKLTYISPQSRHFLQCEPEETMTKWTEFITDNPINKEGIKHTEEAIKTGEKQPSYNLELVGKEGKSIVVEVNENPVTKDGKTVAIVGALTDISAHDSYRKLQSVIYNISNYVSTNLELDDLYTEIHNQLSKIIDTTNFFIALVNHKKKTISFPYCVDEYLDPPKPMKMLGTTLSEYVIKKGTPSYFHEDDIYQLSETGKVNINHSGSVPKVWLGAPYKIDERQSGIIVIQNYHDSKAFTESDLSILNFVSEQIGAAIRHQQDNERLKKSEKKYRTLANKLTESNLQKELLLDIITHDLKNPIGVIASLSEFIDNEKPDMDALKIIKNAGRSQQSILENVTTLAQIAVGDEIEFETHNLTDLIYTQVELMDERLKHNHMEIFVDLPENLTAQVNMVITSIFRNYLSNAVKHAKEGQKMTITHQENTNNITLYFNDFGKTIPARYRTKIFQRRYTVSKTSEKNNGLGLSIVKRIALAHNGAVGVKPNEPTGNSFYLKIPKTQSIG